jgi:alpha/beta superfamily hydrolase
MSWKDRGVTISVPGEQIVLEGVWQGGFDRAALIAPPHPEFGGSLDNPVVTELAYGLYKASWSSLRFNWRGVGASQGTATGDLEAADADFSAALRHLVETVEAPVLGAGYSFGAATAIRIALRDPRVRDLLLVAPPASMVQTLPLHELRGELNVVSGSEDLFSPPEVLSEILSPLPNARLEVITGADHFFAVHGLADISEFARTAAG